jgi:platelet-activating factor acetylhydrolase
LVFSHGLGGSRNAYSHLLGLLASYGVVAIAPEHRDGSAPTSFVKDHNSSKLVPIDYRSIPHHQTKEVEEARDEQLKIRLWELGMIHEALLKIDRGERLPNIASDATAVGTEDKELLHKFAASLDIHRPGSISWAGHSFGAATVVQFVKSVFYRPSKHTGDQYRPLYIPGQDSSIVQQITPSTTISLLDLWTLPLRSTFTRWLWDKPLPCYSPDGPGGSVVLAILSETFFKWRGNLIQTKRAVSANPSGDRRNQLSKTPPYIFYPVKTAHLSQSDFGVLFPWTTKAIFKAEEPERTLKLNVLAIVELMRQNGSEVARASPDDKVAVQRPLQGPTNGHSIGSIFTKVNGQGRSVPLSTQVKSADEVSILATDGSIRGWIPVDVEEETKPGEGENEKTSVEADPNEAVRETEVTQKL